MMDTNTNFENCLKDPISQENISNLDKQTFSKWHYMNVNEDYTLFSSRCYINRFTFHSTSYLLRHSSNSYSVCFVHKKLEYYGEIIKFCQLDNEIYAFVNCFDEIDSNIIKGKSIYVNFKIECQSLNMRVTVRQM